MPNNSDTSPNHQSPQVEDEINLLELTIILAKHKAMIIKMTLAAMSFAVGISLLLPNVYSSTTKIFPPQRNQPTASTMLGQLGGLAGLAGGAFEIKNPDELYITMLKSRTMLEQIAKRFDLAAIYKTKTMTDTLNALLSSSTFNSGKDGVITVEVSDLDPKRAAAMANAFIEELNTQIQTNALNDASLKRAFFEQQLHQVRDKLTDAEIQLDKTPNTSLHYLDAVRNLKYQEALWEIIAKQFEVAKLDEAKDFPVLQVLDKAIPPERKSKPNRSLIVMLVAIAAFFIAVIWAFIREVIEQTMEKPEQAERLRVLRNAIRLRPKV